MSADLSPQRTRLAMQASIAEGALFAIFSAAIGGNLLTGFLLYLGASNSQIGLLSALGPLSSLITIFAAYLLALLPRRKPFMVGLAFIHRTLWALAGFIPLVLPRDAWVWTYLTIYFVANLAVSLAGPAWQSIMADTIPPDRRGQYFGLRNAVIQVATIAAVLLAGHHLDLHPGYDGFRTLHLVALVVGGLDVVAFLAQPEPPYVHERPASLWRHVAMPFRAQSFRVAVLFTAGLGTLAGMVGPFYAVQMIRVLGLSYGFITQLSAVGTATGIIAFLVLGRYMDRVGEGRVVGALPLLSTLAPAVWLFIGPQSVPLLYLVSILQGGLGALHALAIFNLNIGVAPRVDRPIYLAVFAAVNGLGGFIAPVLGGWLSEEYGLLPLLAIAIAGNLLLALLWRRQVRPHVEAALTLGKEH